MDHAPAATSSDPRDVGFLLGILTGEGTFGGDGRQPHITVRMHTRHEGLFRWLQSRFPGGVLYGPYHHGGRSYFQWMCRGPYLRDVVVPILRSQRDLLDEYTATRFDAMCERYGLAPAPDDAQP